MYPTPSRQPRSLQTSTRSAAREEVLRGQMEEKEPTGPAGRRSGSQLMLAPATSSGQAQAEQNLCAHGMKADSSEARAPWRLKIDNEKT